MTIIIDLLKLAAVIWIAYFLTNKFSDLLILLLEMKYGKLEEKNGKRKKEV